MNISGYRPWQYHTQTFKVEFVTRKTCKDQKLLAERHLSSCWASNSQQIMLKQNMAQLRLCFVENYWTKTLHGLCCAHLRSGRDLSQLHRERFCFCQAAGCRATPLVMVQHCSGQALGCTPDQDDQAEFAKTAQFFMFFFKASTWSSIAVKSLPVFLFSHPRCRADSNCAAFFRGFD